MSTDLAVLELSNENKELVRRTICKGCDDDEVALFLMVAKRAGLDVFARQIYARKQWDGKLQREVMIIITSIDGFRLIAQRSGQYAGQLGPQWCGPDGVWKDVWTGDGYPFAARVGVMRHDFKEPIWSVAKWDSYVQTYKDKQTGKVNVTMMWDRMADHMIAKCAESLSLRRACPNELSGMYTEEEADQMSSERPPPAARRDVPAREPSAVVSDSKALPSGSAPKQSPKVVFYNAVKAWTRLNKEDVPSACNEFAKAHGHASAKDLTDEQYGVLAQAAEEMASTGVSWDEWSAKSKA